ncbi:hypothetical protein FKP32DRAFT_1591943 [Trametes sanguinea]|nr:hypothetical protein FKP32DRAFT_1591943 [Trametes sanguinea]
MRRYVWADGDARSRGRTSLSEEDKASAAERDRRYATSCQVPTAFCARMAGELHATQSAMR